MYLPHSSLDMSRVAYAACVFGLLSRKLLKVLVSPRHPATLMKHHPQSQHLPLSSLWGCLPLLHPLPCRAALFPHMEVPAAPRSWKRPLIDLIQWLWSSWSSSNTWARSCCQTVKARVLCLNSMKAMLKAGCLLEGPKPFWPGWWKEEGLALSAWFITETSNFDASKLSPTGHFPNLKNYANARRQETQRQDTTVQLTGWGF